MYGTCMLHCPCIAHVCTVTCMYMCICNMLSRACTTLSMHICTLTCMYMLSHACHMHTHRWRVELYLTPSHLMFTTAGVLCALAVGMAIIIALLHAREKVKPFTVSQLLNLMVLVLLLLLSCSIRTIKRENKQSINFISMQCN